MGVYKSEGQWFEPQAPAVNLSDLWQYIQPQIAPEGMTTMLMEISFFSFHFIELTKSHIH